jgi:hypothetical protein
MRADRTRRDSSAGQRECQPLHRGEPDYSWLGCQLEADRDLSIRLVAARSPARLVSPSGCCNGRAEVRPLSGGRGMIVHLSAIAAVDRKMIDDGALHRAFQGRDNGRRVSIRRFDLSKRRRRPSTLWTSDPGKRSVRNVALVPMNGP